jgi:putative acetyltransferase
MGTGVDYVRDMRPGEAPAVSALLRAAFGGEEEVALVRALRQSQALMGEMVMPLDGGVAGYAGLVWMVAPRGWIALAPVAIAPAMQRRGNGKRMVELITAWARISQTPVVVLGAPGFYESAGFSRAAARGLQTPFSAEHTMLAGVDGAPFETLIYPAPFNAP